MNRIVIVVLSVIAMVFCAMQNVAAETHSFHVKNAGSSGPQNTTSPYTNISALFPAGSFPSDSEIQRYHIVLWTSLALVITALSAVYSLAFMDFKKDTILYSTFNPNWEERKRR